MTLELNISPHTEAKIRERAAAAGQDLETFVVQILNQTLSDTDAQRPTPTQPHEEWVDKLRAFIASHPIATHFVDDSRDSIYAGRGE